MREGRISSKKRIDDHFHIIPKAVRKRHNMISNPLWSAWVQIIIIVHKLQAISSQVLLNHIPEIQRIGSHLLWLTERGPNQYQGWWAEEMRQRWWQYSNSSSFLLVGLLPRHHYWTLRETHLSRVATWIPKSVYMTWWKMHITSNEKWKRKEKSLKMKNGHSPPKRHKGQNQL